MTVVRLAEDSIAIASAASLVVAGSKGSKGLIVAGITGLATITTIEIIRLLSLRKTNRQMEDLLHYIEEA